MNVGTKSATPCYRKVCRRPLSEHVDNMCPRGDGGMYSRHKQLRRISASFSADAIEVGASVLLALLKGGDVRLMMRRPAFGTFAKTVASIAARAAKRPEQPIRRNRMQEMVLAKLYAHGPMTRAQIQPLIGKSTDATVSALVKLRKRGLVTCTRGVRSPVWSVVPSNVTSIDVRKAVAQ